MTEAGILAANPHCVTAPNELLYDDDDDYYYYYYYRCLQQ